MTLPETALARDAAPDVAAEDRARADLYGLIANLFYAAPSAELLNAIAAADGVCVDTDATPFCTAWRRLQQACRDADPAAVREEFDRLFVGVGRGLVLPYASFYLTGFLMEKPLARLREDLTRLNLAKQSAVGEPEDHLAAICDVMRFLILGSDEQLPADLDRQREFFDRYLKPWYARLCEDLQTAKTAVFFYFSAAALALAFFDLEVDSFDIK